jgi:hypothetical protein
MADDEIIPPSEPEFVPRGPGPGFHPASFQSDDNTVALSGRSTIHAATSGNITVSDTPLPARAEADAAIGLGWHQPLSQPLPQVSTHLMQGGLVEPPFPPPVHVEAHPTGVAASAEAGTVSVTADTAHAEGASVAGQVDPADAGGRYIIGGEPGIARTFVVNAEGGHYNIGGEPSILKTLDAKQSSFDTLMARVALLEATLSRPAGVGHNQGPHLDDALSVDEAGIQNLIALLKEQHATAPVDLAKLTEAAKIADPTINKWRERVDLFVKLV